MTIVALASVKGAPGVTTVACLLGATWPYPDRVLLVECDPAGGDLAARFRLSSRRGWHSMTAAARRGGDPCALDDHVQELPGGLQVLVDAGPRARQPAAEGEVLIRASRSVEKGPRDVIVDLGRIVPGNRGQQEWLGVADGVLIVLRSDAPSLLHVRHWARAIPPGWADRTSLAVVGRCAHDADEMQRFVGLPVSGRLTEDRSAAAILCGVPGSRRRLHRSPLVSEAAQLAAVLHDRAAGRENDADVLSSELLRPDITEDPEGARATVVSPRTRRDPVMRPDAFRRWFDRVRQPWTFTRHLSGSVPAVEGSSAAVEVETASDDGMARSLR